MTAFYNEIDPFAAEWLRQLIAKGLIAPGVVDERSIEDIRPDELLGYTQCHFFAGIGVWSYALRAAGWPDDKPVWTGSCPCQPFSSAGKGDGFADERHLWPAFYHLIKERKPPIVFGEQVASKDGLDWLDLVQADLEKEGYAFGAADLCSAGIGAPHIRQRLNFVAMGNACSKGLEGLGVGYCSEGEWDREVRPIATPSRSCGVAYTTGQRCDKGGEGYASAECNGTCGNSTDNRPGPVNGFWNDADWLFCRDGKWRPVKSGTSPLANGIAARVGRLRGYGNAVNAEVTRLFIETVVEVA